MHVQDARWLLWAMFGFHSIRGANFSLTSVCPVSGRRCGGINEPSYRRPQPVLPTSVGIFQIVFNAPDLPNLDGV
jgi:hypothetical protein